MHHYQYVEVPSVDPDSTAVWNLMFRQLCGFHAKYWHCDVPRTYSENLELARWIWTQRQQYRQLMLGHYSPMTEARVAALEAMGFRWEDKATPQETIRHSAGSGMARDYEHSGHAEQTVVTDAGSPYEIDTPIKVTHV